MFSNFNPRTHKECDEIINPAYDWFNKFQSTHSQGVRLNGGSYLNVNVDISIHALTKSATPLTSQNLLAISISIHALTKSATGFVLAIECLMLISIHAPTKSATDYRQTSSGDCMISIHALTKSATHFQSHCLTAKKYFNPRTHKECDK